jgi:molybdopterin converting factor small subunit
MFAGAREQVRSDSVEIEVELPISVQKLKEAIASQFESARFLVEFSRIAIDNEFAIDSHVIDSMQKQSVIALIPPVSGG